MKKFVVALISFTMILVCVLSNGCSFLNQTPEPDEPQIDEELPDEPQIGDDSNNEKNIVSTSEKIDLYEGTYESSSTGSYYGVGRTLNVIEDPYIEVSAGYKKVFDVDKLLAMNWRKTNVGKMKASSYSAESMEELYTNLNEEYSVAFGVNLGIGVFNAGIKADFDFASDEDYSETSNEIFYKASQIYSATMVEIDGYYDVEQFETILSKEVLEDAYDVQRGEMTPEEFIYLYGTHAILAGYYGGKIDCTYYLRNIGTKWSQETTSNIKSGINLGIGKLLSMETDVGFSMQEEFGLNRSETEERFIATALGGSNFSALSMNDFLSNYGTWADSMNEADEFGVIVGLPRRSLVAIWDMFPSEYNEAKNILNEYFEKTAKNTESEFLKLYERYYPQPDDEEQLGNTEQFAGGHGTEESPYLISTKENFINIGQIETTGVYFKLINSINLGTWNSPFSFNGIFDGNYNTITYYQRLTSQDEYYTGLFSKLNAATIKNLNLEANISRNDNGGRGHIGGLAGEVTDNTTISRIAVKGNIAIESNNGYDYVGGLFGSIMGGTIEECAVDCNISNSTRQARVGGLVGYATSRDLPIKIINCLHKGNLTASSAYIIGIGYAVRVAGGIVGYAQNDQAFPLTVSNCYHDGEIKLEWLKNSTGGTNGRGGTIGRLESSDKDNIKVENCYWDNTQVELSGNAKELNESGSRDNLYGTLPGFDSTVWALSDSALPELLWTKGLI